jgi:hypothetical protein
MTRYKPDMFCTISTSVLPFEDDMESFLEGLDMTAAVYILPEVFHEGKNIPVSFLVLSEMYTFDELT